MKQNKVLFYTENGLFVDKIQKMEKFLLSRGLFDFSFNYFSDFQEFEKKCKEEKDREGFTVVLCENNKIDALLEEIKSDGDSFTLVKEQSVKLERDNGLKEMIFVPIELAFEDFLEEFLPKNEVFVCSLYWISRKKIKEKFDILKNGFDLEYKIISETRDLHKVYFSKFLEQERLEFEFGDCLYSDKDEPLANRCATLLKDNDLTISVAEHCLNGRLIGIFANENELKPLLTQSLLFLNTNQIKDFGVCDDLIDEQQAVNHEVLFDMAKNLLKSSKSDIVVTASFEEEYSENNDKRSYVTLGDKEKFYQYGFVRLGKDKQESLVEFCDYILYRLYIYLKQKTNLKN